MTVIDVLLFSVEILLTIICFLLFKKFEAMNEDFIRLLRLLIEASEKGEKDK